MKSEKFENKTGLIAIIIICAILIIGIAVSLCALFFNVSDTSSKTETNEEIIIDADEAKETAENYLNDIAENDFYTVENVLEDVIVGNDNPSPNPRELYCDMFIERYIYNVAMSDTARDTARGIFKERLYNAFDTITYEIEEVKTYGDTATISFILNAPQIGIASHMEYAYATPIDGKALTEEQLISNDSLAISNFINSLDVTCGDFSAHRIKTRCSITLTTDGEDIYVEDIEIIEKVLF